MQKLGEGGGPSIEGPPPAWPAAEKTPHHLMGWLPAHWLPAHSLANSRDLHLLTMATGVLLSLLTCKTELVARGVYGAVAKRNALLSWRRTLPCGGTTSTMPRVS